MKPQLLIGSPMSGSGKSIFTMGFLRLLKRRNLNVQPFVCGPDQAVPLYHAIACGHDSVNLDTFLASKTHLQYVYNTYSENAEICVAEGNMGLFDGYNRMRGSSAEIAMMLKMPVLMIVNARATGYSAAPLLYGFKHFKHSLNIVGVIFNQVTSSAQYASLKEACFDAGIACLGYIPFIEGLKYNRRMALTVENRRTIGEMSDLVADLIEKHVDVDRLLNQTVRIFPCEYTLPYTSDIETLSSLPAMPKKGKLRIAIARDPAFCMVYKENIDRLSTLGTIKYFSPVFGSELPEADLIYLPGGFPDLFARQLHRRKQLLEQLKDYAERGGKILAEGGGMALLSQSLSNKPGGTPYEMAGILPFRISADEQKYTGGYRCITLNNTEYKGHEFHFSKMENTPCEALAEIRLYTARGTESSTSLYRYKNVIAGYTHWYWGESDILDLWK